MRPTDTHLKAMRTLKSAFEQFIRTGRWGTCSACPVDNDGKYYPECCENTDRYDHSLTFDALIDAYKYYFK